MSHSIGLCLITLWFIHLQGPITRVHCNTHSACFPPRTTLVACGSVKVERFYLPSHRLLCSHAVFAAFSEGAPKKAASRTFGVLSKNAERTSNLVEVYGTAGKTHTPPHCRQITARQCDPGIRLDHTKRGQEIAAVPATTLCCSVEICGAPHSFLKCH